jgi:UDP-N-acetylmuramoylalanine--D-glutamate ligase
VEGQKCLVIGSGISGIGAVTLLEREKRDVILFDGSTTITVAELEAKLPPESEAMCFAGSLPEDILDQIHDVILSPGVPTDIPLVTDLRRRGARILGEIELAFQFEKGRVAAITGTNGKTTTTTLVGDIIKAHLGADKVFVVGNIGTSYTAQVEKTASDTVTIAEISSFQLETVRSFRPYVSAILNITPDHLNRHHTMEAYVTAKEAVAAKQQKSEVCVLNYDNSYTRAFGDKCPARAIYFSVREELSEGYYLRGEMIMKACGGVASPLLDIYKDMQLVGLCNVENVMAAIAIAETMGVPMDIILAVIRTFKAVEHRIEYVSTKGGVDYYNDSKATNPDAAIQGIRAMRRPTILIAGGYDKQNDYNEWIDNFDGKVKALVLLGQTKEAIAACAKAHGFTGIYLTDTWEQCLKQATALAESGDAILLSPACASWGMFPNYEVRGNQFKEYVNHL